MGATLARDLEVFQAGAKLGHGKIHAAHRRRRPAPDVQCRHRHDHPQAVPEDDRPHRSGAGPVPRIARPRFRPRPPRLAQCQDSRRRRQFRLRLEPRARGLGAARFRHPLRHRAELRRHLLQQLLQERHPGARPAAGAGRQADGRRRARRQCGRLRRSRAPGDPRPRRRLHPLRDRSVPQAMPAERLGRHRAHPARRKRDHRFRGAGGRDRRPGSSAACSDRCRAGARRRPACAPRW